MIIGSSNVTVSVNVATPSGLSRWASPVDVSSALAFDPGTGAAHATVETRAASATTSKVELVQEGIDAVSRGDCCDALEAVASLRGKYGL